MADENEEPDEELEEGEDGEGKKKKGGIMKLALFIGLPVIILLLGGVAAMLLLSGGGDDEHVVAEGEHGEASDGHGDDGHGGGGGHGDDDLTIVALSPIMVSIVDASGRNAILNLEISFETSDSHLAEDLVHVDGDHTELTDNGRRLVDQYMAFLRELHPEDIAGSAGMQRIRLELLRRAQLVLGEDRVSAVLITQMLIT